MKKIYTLMVVAAAFAFASCGNAQKSAPATDEAAEVATEVVEEAGECCKEGEECTECCKEGEKCECTEKCADCAEKSAEEAK